MRRETLVNICITAAVSAGVSIVPAAVVGMRVATGVLASKVERNETDIEKGESKDIAQDRVLRELQNTLYQRVKESETALLNKMEQLAVEQARQGSILERWDRSNGNARKTIFSAGVHHANNIRP